MKKLPLYFLVVFISSCSILRKEQNSSTNPVYENNTFTYTYDFSNPTPEKDHIQDARNLKDRVIIKIVNINRLAFDIISDSKNISIITNNINLFDSLANSLNTSKVTVGSSKSILPNVDSTKTDQINTTYKNIIQKEKKINDEFQKIVNNMKQLEYFLNFSKTVPNIISEERGNQSNLKSKLLTNFYLKQYDDNIQNLDDLIAKNSVQPEKLALEISKSYKKVVTIKKDNDSLLTSITKLCNESSDKKINICNCLDKIENNFPEDLNKIISEASKINPDSVSKAVEILNNLISQVNDPNNFIYSTSCYPEGDYLQIGIKIKPKNTKGPFSTDSILFKIPVKGQFEWAIGPYLNFCFTNNSFDRSFQIDSARNSNGTSKKDDMFTIKQNNSNKFLMPSIGVMATFYWQNHNTVTPGINLGLSTGPTDISTLKAYLGFSLLFGGFANDNNKNLIYNKIIFSAGLAYGQVNRLKENLILGDNPKSQVPFVGNAVASDQLVEKVGRVGLYVGFTYKINKLG